VNQIDKFIIFAPTYNENIGGVVLLHKLCHLLNENKSQSFLFPFFASSQKYLEEDSIDLSYLENILETSSDSLMTNPKFNTPILENIELLKNLDSWAVIYPEIVAKNPMKAKNVIRWLLHYPGFHTGKVEYGANELYFKGHQQMHDSECTFDGSTTSKVPLYIIHYPLDLYNLDNTASQRLGIAYCIYKGKGRKIDPSLENAILIDGKPHTEIAKIFKKVTLFVSYDLHTAYSTFATLCGCISVVIPEDGLSEESWRADPATRYGIAYGFDKVEQVSRTTHLVLEHTLEEERNETKKIENFINEIHIFFYQKRENKLHKVLLIT
jgi:hypothetical protein